MGNHNLRKKHGITAQYTTTMDSATALIITILLDFTVANAATAATPNVVGVDSMNGSFLRGDRRVLKLGDENKSGLVIIAVIMGILLLVFTIRMKFFMGEYVPDNTPAPTVTQKKASSSPKKSSTNGSSKKKGNKVGPTSSETKKKKKKNKSSSSSTKKTKPSKGLSDNV